MNRAAVRSLTVAEDPQAFPCSRAHARGATELWWELQYLHRQLSVRHGERRKYTNGWTGYGKAWPPCRCCRAPTRTSTSTAARRSAPLRRRNALPAACARTIALVPHFWRQATPRQGAARRSLRDAHLAYLTHMAERAARVAAGAAQLPLLTRSVTITRGGRVEGFRDLVVASAPTRLWTAAVCGAWEALRGRAAEGVPDPSAIAEPWTAPATASRTSALGVLAPSARAEASAAAVTPLWRRLLADLHDGLVPWLAAGAERYVVDVSRPAPRGGRGRPGGGRRPTAGAGRRPAPPATLGPDAPCWSPHAGRPARRRSSVARVLQVRAGDAEPACS